jgi:glycosyltransferase involved in cell wall biosynthesis
MNIVHLTASRFYGGPERQMLGLGRSLPPEWRSRYVSFSEGGRCCPFLQQAGRQGFEAFALRHDTPHLLRAARELTALLRAVRADVLCCHGYKADLLGRIAAGRCRVPVAAVSRGWTGETLRVRLYEWLDRLCLRWPGMDRVVCVSQGQADRVLAAGVNPRRVVVIRNAIQTDRFARPDPVYRERLRGLLPRRCHRIVGAAGRLSPDKGFGVLVEAALRVVREERSAGFVLFGDGPLREDLCRAVAAAGLSDRFVLAGFHDDLDRFMPFFDVLALPSYNEGLPNVVLEALAAGVPVVATAVGGTPEVVEDGVTGYLVPPGDAGVLAERILDLLGFEANRRRLGRRGQERVRREFTFAAQAGQYERLFAELTGGPLARPEHLSPRKVG